MLRLTRAHLSQFDLNIEICNVTDKDLEAQEEHMLDQYCQQLEAQMRMHWVLVAIPADLEAALMQEKARSVVH